MGNHRTKWKNILLRLINVKPCLVARHTIVAKIVQIILNPCNVWKAHYCGKNSWQTIFFLQENVSVKQTLDCFFSGKNLACLPVPKKSDRLLNPS